MTGLSRNISNKLDNLKSKKIILTIIIIAIIIVILAIVLALIFNPERQSKIKIESLAKNYYENITYESLVSSKDFSGDVSSALQKYEEKGLPTVTLRQLLLDIESVSKQEYDYLSNYCDTEKTYVQFFPESPFSRTDYHIDYTYSCNF